jgi:hypothetical protein
LELALGSGLQSVLGSACQLELESDWARGLGSVCQLGLESVSG